MKLGTIAPQVTSVGSETHCSGITQGSVRDPAAAWERPLRVRSNWGCFKVSKMRLKSTRLGPASLASQSHHCIRFTGDEFGASDVTEMYAESCGLHGMTREHAADQGAQWPPLSAGAETGNVSTKSSQDSDESHYVRPAIVLLGAMWQLVKNQGT